MAISRLKNFFLEKTEGNGNCAFNAFILGFSRQTVIDNIENGFLQEGEDPNISMRDFIQRAAATLKIQSDWSVLKQELMQLRQRSKVLLQNRLAPVLRDLAISLAEKDKDHATRTIEPLLSAFDDYVQLQKEGSLHKRNSQRVEDDIFTHHSFIQQKFSDFFLKHTDAREVVKEVENWWLGSSSTESGYRQFLNMMKIGGMWAGDLELFQLARYFHINLDVLRDNYVHRVYSHSGKVPSCYFTYDQINQLILRQVINMPEVGDEELHFFPLTELELRERIGPIPEFEKIAWYIMENEFIKGFSIPEDWEASLKQLWIRNLIERKNNHYVFIADRETAMKFSAAMQDAETIVHLWQRFHWDAPTVILSNPHAIHWSNVLPTEEKPNGLPPSQQRSFNCRFFTNDAVKNRVEECPHVFLRKEEL